MSPVELGLVHAALGERDQAFRWLDRAREERSTWLPWLWAGRGVPELDGDPRFAALRRAIGLAGEGEP